MNVNLLLFYVGKCGSHFFMNVKIIPKASGHRFDIRKNWTTEPSRANIPTKSYIKYTLQATNMIFPMTDPWDWYLPTWMVFNVP